MEEETKKMVWKGKIPVCFSLAEDSSGMGGVGMDRAAPEPCYVSLYQHIYIYMTLTNLSESFCLICIICLVLLQVASWL